VRYDGEVEGDAVGSRLHSDFLFFTEHMLFNQPVGVALSVFELYTQNTKYVLSYTV
jgi:hypothetical protein